MKEDWSSEETEENEEEFLVQSRLLYFDICFRSYRDIAVSPSGVHTFGKTFDHRHHEHHERFFYS